MTTDKPRRIAILGGGISGLAAAHRLNELNPQVEITLLEASDRLGGVLHTERRDGFLLEHSADMFTTRDPWALDLCRRVGLEDQLISTNEANRKAFVVRRGRPCPVPEGFTLMSPARIWPILKSPILSPLGKLRLACERLIPAREETGDESLAAFTTRRLGRETYQRLVQPLIGGIYTADPTKLSMEAAMPQFLQMEREHGSLIRGMRRAGSKRDRKPQSGSGARYGMFVAPRHGMGTLADAIASRLPEGSVRLNTRAEKLVPAGSGGWEVKTEGAPAERFDAVVVAAPARISADLVQDADPQLADELSGIEYASAAIVIVAYRRDQIADPLNGFGLVAPLCEKRNVLSISFSSIKFSGRAPEGHVLLRAFVGGACQGELVDRDDEQLRSMVFAELESLLGARGAPQPCEIIRWRHTMPQYHLGHLERVARIEERLGGLPGLVLAGNAYRGVGVPFCIRSGERAAETLLGHHAG